MNTAGTSANMCAGLVSSDVATLDEQGELDACEQRKYQLLRQIFQAHLHISQQKLLRVQHEAAQHRLAELEHSLSQQSSELLFDDVSQKTRTLPQRTCAHFAFGTPGSDCDVLEEAESVQDVLIHELVANAAQPANPATNDLRYGTHRPRHNGVANSMVGDALVQRVAQWWLHESYMARVDRDYVPLLLERSAAVAQREMAGMPGVSNAPPTASPA